MKPLIYIISLLLMLLDGFCIFLLVALDGFSSSAIFMALPALVLMLLLKAYKDNSKAKNIKPVIVLMWFVLAYVSVNFYIELTNVNWR